MGDKLQLIGDVLDDPLYLYTKKIYTVRLGYAALTNRPLDRIGGLDANQGRGRKGVVSFIATQGPARDPILGTEQLRTAQPEGIHAIGQTGKSTRRCPQI